jgi:hypothetical protein
MGFPPSAQTHSSLNSPERKVEDKTNQCGVLRLCCDALRLCCDALRLCCDALRLCCDALRLCCDALRLCCDALHLCFGCAIVIVTCLNVFACSGTTTTPASRRQTPPAPGFFERMKNEFNKRDCNVGRFVCPYGLGPVGEPCECTDPSGVVVRGRTVK